MAKQTGDEPGWPVGSAISPGSVQRVGDARGLHKRGRGPLRALGRSAWIPSGFVLQTGVPAGMEDCWGKGVAIYENTNDHRLLEADLWLEPGHTRYFRKVSARLRGP